MQEEGQEQEKRAGGQAEKQTGEAGCRGCTVKGLVEAEAEEEEV